MPDRNPTGTVCLQSGGGGKANSYEIKSVGRLLT
jgi:hypothetical protein